MKTRFAITAVAMLSTGAIACADTVDLNFLGTGKGRNVRISIGGDSLNVFAGQLRHNFSNGTGAGADLSGEILTYCTDLLEHVSSSTKTFDIVDLTMVPDFQPMSAARAGAITDLYRFAAGSQLSASASKDFAAAFQIAVWEVVTDFDLGQGRSSLDVEDGAFSAFKTNGASLASGVQGHVTSLFDAIGSFTTPDSRNTQILALRNEGAQDQLIEQIIPTPMAGMLGLAGFAGVASVRRRRLN